jgi:putative transposase
MAKDHRFSYSQVTKTKKSGENTMAYPFENSAKKDIFEILAEDGFDGLGKAVEILINEAMRLEREKHIGAHHYERTEERQTYANGFKPKTIKSRLGELALSVPQTRDGKFYPSCLEKGLRSERALNIALAEMYIQGVSTRKVTKIIEGLCGFEVNSMQVSRATQLLDEELKAWRDRALGYFQYLILDARYEKVRQGGAVIDAAVLIAIGVDSQGRRQVLGVSVSLSEAEVHWRKFLTDLQQRGLHGVEFITSDAHTGLKAALKTVYPGVKWQRCQFHLQQNAQSYIPRQDMKEDVAQEIRKIFNCGDRTEADRLLKLAIEKFVKKAPKLCDWMEVNIPEGLTVFELPEAHRKKMRTSNPLERVNREIKRRTRVATIFPNEASCLRLVTAILMEISEEWETGNIYLKKIAAV